MSWGRRLRGRAPCRIGSISLDQVLQGEAGRAVAQEQRGWPPSTDRHVPTLEQIRHVIHSMPSETDIEKRNRALIAFAILTGARDSAVASMRLKDVDLVEGKIEQDARHCRTKFAKSFTTFFFPVGDDIRAIVAEWVGFLRDELHLGPDDALFPKTKMGLGPSRQFEATGLDQRGWSNATPIRSIFRQAFAAAGLPYFNPHSFRNTLVRLGQQTCEKSEAFKAWSQNLGHEKVLTTFSSYGHVETHRQGELIREMGLPNDEMATLIALGRTVRAVIDAQRK